MTNIVSALTPAADTWILKEDALVMYTPEPMAIAVKPALPSIAVANP
jgi:hypothetical protein